jgi:hypothetical protein
VILKIQKKKQQNVGAVPRSVVHGRTPELEQLIPFIVPVLASRLVATPPAAAPEPTEEIRLKLMNIAVALVAAHAPLESGGKLIDGGSVAARCFFLSSHHHKTYIIWPSQS